MKDDTTLAREIGAAVVWLLIICSFVYFGLGIAVGVGW